MAKETNQNCSFQKLPLWSFPLKIEAAMPSRYPDKTRYTLRVMLFGYQVLTTLLGYQLRYSVTINDNPY